MVQIKINGMKQMLDKLGSIDAIKALEPAMQRAVLRLEGRMKVYPPTRPGQRYVRTGTLGKRWTNKLEHVTGGLRGKIGNNTVYGPFVQSSQFQRPFFRNRWQTDQQVLDEERGAIIQDFERAIAAAL